jgi:RNA recognition motif-containing protein
MSEVEEPMNENNEEEPKKGEEEQNEEEPKKMEEDGEEKKEIHPKDIPGTSILVRNMDYKCDAEALKAHFSKHCEVLDAHVPTNYYTRRPRGFGFIKVKDDETANKIIEELNEKFVEGFEERPLKLLLANKSRRSRDDVLKSQRRDRDRRGGGRRYGGGGGYGGGRRRFRSRSRSYDRSRRYRSRSRSRSPPRRRSRSRSPPRRRSRSRSPPRRRSRSRSPPRRRSRSRSRSYDRRR